MRWTLSKLKKRKREERRMLRGKRKKKRNLPRSISVVEASVAQPSYGWVQPCLLRHFARRFASMPWTCSASAASAVSHSPCTGVVVVVAVAAPVPVPAAAILRPDRQTPAPRFLVRLRCNRRFHRPVGPHGCDDACVVRQDFCHSAWKTVAPNLLR